MSTSSALLKRRQLTAIAGLAVASLLATTGGAVAATASTTATAPKPSGAGIPGTELPPAGSEPVATPPTDMKGTASVGYDVQECGLHDGNPCNPKAEAVYTTHVKWVRNGST